MEEQSTERAVERALHLRDRLALSELAEVAGSTYTVAGNWSNGRTLMPAEARKRVAAYLDVVGEHVRQVARELAGTVSAG